MGSRQSRPYAHAPSGLCFDCCALIAEQVQVIITGPWIPDDDWSLEPPDEAA
jgi:hypothetical protein